MYRIGTDVGSTFTKYCVMSEDNRIVDLVREKTPVSQLRYFNDKRRELSEKYPDAVFASCGYGRKNTCSETIINELTALARGTNFIYPEFSYVLDIGGQDTKIINHNNGRIKTFFVNDKCAAGSGSFLINVCEMLGTNVEGIDLTNADKPEITLSSVCAVFAQSEIVKLIAENVPPEVIINAVIRQILTQAGALLKKVTAKRLLLSGGLTSIKGIDRFASLVLGVECFSDNYSPFLSALGCALSV